jgi:hypothetical protein
MLNSHSGSQGIPPLALGFSDLDSLPGSDFDEFVVVLEWVRCGDGKDASLEWEYGWNMIGGPRSIWSHSLCFFFDRNSTYFRVISLYGGLSTSG